MPALTKSADVSSSSSSSSRLPSGLHFFSSAMLYMIMVEVLVMFVAV